jgi:hypothetical protein
MQERLQSWSDTQLIADLFAQYAHFFKMFVSILSLSLSVCLALFASLSSIFFPSILIFCFHSDFLFLSVFVL